MWDQWNKKQKQQRKSIELRAGSFSRSIKLRTSSKSNQETNEKTELPISGTKNDYHYRSHRH